MASALRSSSAISSVMLAVLSKNNGGGMRVGFSELDQEVDAGQVTDAVGDGHQRTSVRFLMCYTLVRKKEEGPCYL